MTKTPRSPLRPLKPSKAKRKDKPLPPLGENWPFPVSSRKPQVPALLKPPQ